MTAHIVYINGRYLFYTGDEPRGQLRGQDAHCDEHHEDLTQLDTVN